MLPGVDECGDDHFPEIEYGVRESIRSWELAEDTSEPQIANAEDNGRTGRRRCAGLGGVR